MWNVSIHLFQLQFLTFLLLCSVSYLALPWPHCRWKCYRVTYSLLSFYCSTIRSLYSNRTTTKKCRYTIAVRFDPGICIPYSIVHCACAVFVSLFFLSIWLCLSVMCHFRVKLNWTLPTCFVLLFFSFLYWVCDSFVIVFPVTLPWSITYELKKKPW